MKERVEYEVGIDEAGRGPLAGPVAVGIVVVAQNFDWKLLPGVTDSKKLTPKKRAEIFAAAKRLQKNNTLAYKVAMVSAQKIDEIGIVPAIRLATVRALSGLTIDPNRARVKLDGGLSAPEIYRQETIIKGDEKERVIGLASICAKETRDAYMVRIADKPQFAPYDFQTHKGYGTKAHREAIKLYGLSTEHRPGYCKNCQ